MKKSANCTALLVSLILLSAGVNYIFIGTTGGRVIKQPQQAQREVSTSQQISAVECTPEPEHCSIAIR